MEFQLAGNDRLDEAVLEISTSYFQLFVPGSSLRGICETWISGTGLTYPEGAPLLALELQRVLRGLFDIPSFIFPVQTRKTNDKVIGYLLCYDDHAILQYGYVKTLNDYRYLTTYG